MYAAVLYLLQLSTNQLVAYIYLDSQILILVLLISVHKFNTYGGCNGRYLGQHVHRFAPESIARRATETHIHTVQIVFSYYLLHSDCFMSCSINTLDLRQMFDKLQQWQICIGKFVSLASDLKRGAVILYEERLYNSMLCKL